MSILSMDKILRLNNNKIKLSNPDKLLWAESGITKLDYINYLMQLSPFLLKYTKNRYLSTIRYPDGYTGDFFYQKNTPSYAPDYVEQAGYKGVSYVNLSSIETLVWLGTLASLEFHVSFNMISHDNSPWCIVFDLDPSTNQSFDEVASSALLVKEVLDELNIISYLKTSGSKGLQIYIPVGNRYDYDTARSISLFFAEYLVNRHPKNFTIERLKKHRKGKLYFDYLQMWEGKSIIAPYSPRARKGALVSTPITWDELKQGIHPSDFRLDNIINRLSIVGDLFEGLHDASNYQNLDFILDHI